jgi:chemosensory pili system protein ChpA (sensor histidine kinase/response regulator)
MTHTSNASALKWVKKELDESLRRARHFLELYVGDSQEAGHLHNCLEELHQVNGSLQMIDLQGATMLAGEMEGLARSLIENGVHNRVEAFEVLMQGILRMPDYLDWVSAGHIDRPVMLLPEINVLRMARGQEPITENVLFTPDDIGVPMPDFTYSARAENPDDNLREIARKQRHVFQTGLLAWYRGNSPATALPRMLDALVRLQDGSADEPVARFWWISAGVVEALCNGGLETSSLTKQLLGQVDRQIKRLIDEGPAGFSEALPGRLLSNLLYCIAKSERKGERTCMIKDTYSLPDMFLEGDAWEQARGSMSVLNSTLVNTVSSEIIEEISYVKDTLDIFARAGAENTSQLAPLAENLRVLGNTLELLGFEHERNNILEQVRIVDELTSGRLTTSDDILMQIAGAVVAVESSLDYLLKGGAPACVESNDAEDGAPEVIKPLPHVNDAVIRETLIDIGHAKEAIVALTKTPPVFEALAGVPHLFSQVRGGLHIIGQDRAAALGERIGDYVEHEIIRRAHVPDDELLNKLADAICSVEYYLQDLRDGGKGGDIILDVAAHSLDTLCGAGSGAVATESADHRVCHAGEGQRETPRIPEEERHTREFGQLGPHAYDEDGDFGHTGRGEQPTGARDPAEIRVQECQADDVPADSALGVVDRDVEGEILEIFLEEADEQLSRIADSIPLWVDDPSDSGALESLRRAFHTLKGSGRMVGAQALSELAWAFEDMLNRVVDGSIMPGPSMLDLVQRVPESLSLLVEQIREKAEKAYETHSLRVAARGLSHGDAARSCDEEVPEAADHDAAAAQHMEQTSTEADADPELADGKLLEIFQAECRRHLQIIREFLRSSAAADRAVYVTNELLRALHTLHGSAKTARANYVVHLVHEFDVYFRAYASAGQAVPQKGVELLDRSADLLDFLVENLDAGLEQVPGYLELAETLAAEPRPEDDNEDARSDSSHGPVWKTTAAEPCTRDECAGEDAKSVRTTTGDLHEGTAGPDEDPYAALDPELLEVFLEEGREIIEATEAVLRRLANAPGDRESLGELQRQLHTLKGGARMAGITAIGDLSHSVESMLTALVDDQIAVSEQVFDVLQLAHDRLAAMLEHVLARRPLDSAAPLIERIGHLAIRGEQSADAPLEPEADVREDGDGSECAGTAYGTGDDVPAATGPEPSSACAAQTTQLHGPALQEESNIVHLQPQGEPPPDARTKQEQIRIRADLLDSLVNYAGEISIYRSRLEQQVGAFRFNLVEFQQTVNRLREQLRKLEIETEAQILFRYEQVSEARHEEFDPLEMDRFSKVQQLSRSLMEGISDLGSIQGLLENITRESETLLLQQARVNTELQEGLMRTRMIPFAGLAPRMRRIVRQTSQELGREVELELEGEQEEMDRTVIDRIIAPIEHMLRNAVSHGIEKPEHRLAIGKPACGTIKVSLAREGQEVLVRLADDGSGIDIAAIRAKALERGLMTAESPLSDNEILHFILETGLSTAKEVTQISGRGVGMDVVNREVKQLGGALHIDSKMGMGTVFTIRLPLTLAINQALLVQAGSEIFCIPLSNIEGVLRIDRDELEGIYHDPDPVYEYAGMQYRLQHLGTLLGAGSPSISPAPRRSPVLLVRAGEHRVALHVEGLLGNREIVVKPMGAQISAVPGVTGATILGDGRVVLILDIAALLRTASPVQAWADETFSKKNHSGLTVMVVDDSITVRKVTARLLERNSMNVISAKDGVDALAKVQECIPDVVLLDIEMPRMDGFELAMHIRNDARLRNIPIIMITSRTGDKHRQRAMEIGVNRYIGKPYQETDLLATIHGLLEEAGEHA